MSNYIFTEISELLLLLLCIKRRTPLLVRIVNIVSIIPNLYLSFLLHVTNSSNIEGLLESFDLLSYVNRKLEVNR